MDDFERQNDGDDNDDNCDDNDGDGNDYGGDDDSQIENVFLHARSGRIAGNWRLSSYIAGEKIFFFCFFPLSGKVHDYIFKITILSTNVSASKF